MKFLVLFAAVSLYAQSSEKAPQPSDYPVGPAFSGTPAAPKLTTRNQKRFRTVIRDRARKGMNFAGHYAIVEWGCGTSCVQMAMVDLKSGEVYDGPFGSLYLPVMANDEEPGPVFHSDSSLLVVKGCPNEKYCGTYYYSWTGKQFKLLRGDPLKGSFTCAP